MNKFLQWKKAFESKLLKDRHGETKVIIIDGITKEGFSRSKVDPCAICIPSVKAISVLYVHCGKWIQCRCAELKRVTAKFKRNPSGRKCVGNNGGSGTGRKVVIKWKK